GSLLIQLYGDATAVQVDVHRLTPPTECEFACTVSGFVNDAQPTANAGHVDDDAVPALEHPWQNRQRQPHRGEEVDPHARLDVGRIQRLDQTTLRRRGVVDQYVDATQVVPGAQPEPVD